MWSFRGAYTTAVTERSELLLTRAAGSQASETDSKPDKVGLNTACLHSVTALCNIKEKFYLEEL